MLNNKKYNDYTMRDDFEIQLYIVDKLSVSNSNTYLDKKSSFPGFLKKEGTITKLFIGTWLSKNYQNKEGIIYNFDNKVSSHQDSTIYAQSWDGTLKFSFDRFLFKNAQIVNSIDEYSQYQVLEYKISNTWQFFNKINSIEIRFDYLEGWYGDTMEYSGFIPINDDFYRFEFEGVEVKLLFNDHMVENQSFADGSNNDNISIIERKKYRFMSVKLDFSSSLTREDTLKLIRLLHCFFELLFHKKIGITQIMINNRRNNYFIDTKNTTVFIEELDTRFNFLLIYYSDIKGDCFQKILNNWFKSESVQFLATALLNCSDYDMPVSIQLITLVSAIEIFYSKMKFSEIDSNLVKKIQKNPSSDNSLNTAGKIALLIDEITPFLNQFLFDNDEEALKFIRIIRNSRVYFVHGTQRKNTITNEIDLILPVKKLTEIMHYLVLKTLDIPEEILTVKFQDIFRGIKKMVIY